MVTAGGAVMPIRDRLSVRISAFDRLSAQGGEALVVVGRGNSNPRPGIEETDARQPISDAEADHLIAPNDGPCLPEGPTDALTAHETEPPRDQSRTDSAADAPGKETNNEAIIHTGEVAVDDPSHCPIIEHAQPEPVHVEEPTRLAMRGENET